MIRLLFAYFILSLTACIKISTYLGTEYKTNSLQIPASINKIEINDKRENVSKDPELKLPVISKPNQNFKYFPILDSAHKKVVSELIHKNFDSKKSKSYHLVLDLLEGKKEFISKGLTETEEVKVTLQISIFNQSENFVSESSGTYTIVSADAKYKRFEELYRGALQAVTYKALKNIEVKLSQSK